MLTYEIEIKSLLGPQERAQEFRNTILEKGAEKTSENSQLNHYFIKGDFEALYEKIKSFLNDQQKQKFSTIVEKGENHSVRSRHVDNITKLVIKASVDDLSSENGVSRMEFEEGFDMTLEELDQMLLACDFEYQAKWSRTREEYVLDDITICLDKNAGYGWLTEFELVVPEDGNRQQAEERIRQLMNECGVDQLDPERLERMFNFYNKNWEDYYGTDNIFTLE